MKTIRTSFTIICLFLLTSDFVDAQCLDTISVLPPQVDLATNTLAFAGWGVNLNAPASYSAQVKFGRGVGNDLGNISWIDLHATPLSIACTGWIYVALANLGDLRQNDKIQFRVLMTYPSGQQYVSDVVTYLYRPQGNNLRFAEENEDDSPPLIESTKLTHSITTEQTQVQFLLRRPPVSETVGINIFPNPSSGIINIVFKNDHIGNANLNIYNSIGENVYSEDLKNSSGGFNKQITTNLPLGIYFVKVSDEANQFIEKFCGVTILYYFSNKTPRSISI
jgi:hypothetical protein